MRSHLRLASVLGAASLSVVAVAPALAAAPVSQAGANAITLRVANNEVLSTGQVTATNDGSGEQKNDVNTLPTIASVLKGNPILSAGVAGQDATAQVTDGVGRSAACAGVAGEDGSLVKVGDGNCIKPGKALRLSLANIDLSDTKLIDPDSALKDLEDQLGPLELTLAQVTKALQDALANTPLGELGLGGNFGALQANCTASAGTASGTANLASTSGSGTTPITLTLPGADPVIVANIPVEPPPNTKVVTGLDKVTAAVNAALKKQFDTALNGAGAPLSTLPQTLQDQIVTALVAQLQPLLKPLEDQVLDITLNEQTFPSKDSIKVHALHLRLLPAAGAAVGEALVDLQLGNVACGPNGRVQAAAPAPPAKASPSPTALPTAVSAGAASAPQSVRAPVDNGSTNAVVLGALAVLVSLGAGLVGYRRLRA